MVSILAHLWVNPSIFYILMWSLYSLQSDDFEMLVDSDVSSDNEVDSDSSESDSDGPKSRAGRRQGSWKSKKWFGD